MQIVGKTFLLWGVILMAVVCGPVMAGTTVELGNGTNEAALASADKILETDPNNFEAWLKRAGALQDFNRNNEALESYDRALQINPNSTVAWNNRGTVLYTLGRYNDAVSSFDQSTEDFIKRLPGMEQPRRIAVHGREI